jgi:N,N'-diacetyllegionaminate synthase
MPTSIIAELSTSHGGERAWQDKLIESAATAGADFVKFQSHQTAHLSPADPQFGWMQRAELSDADHKRLIKKCRECGITFLTTPFHADRVPFLAKLGLTAIKVGSGEAMHVPMLEAVAAYPWTIYLSTGLFTLAELDRAMWILRDRDVVLLHCVTKYPTPVADVNMGRMAWLAHHTGRLCGYSDHTIGRDAAIFAIGQCAEVVEVHHSLPAAPRFREWDKDFLMLRRICEFRDSTATMRTVASMMQPEGTKRPFVGRWGWCGE